MWGIKQMFHKIDLFEDVVDKQTTKEDAATRPGVLFVFSFEIQPKAWGD